jgi:hypothetical protein
LRLDEKNGLRAFRKNSENTWQDDSEGDETDVSNSQHGRRQKISILKKTGIEPLAASHSWIGTQPPVELRVPDIHSVNETGSALEQAVRKPACGGSDVHTDETRRINAKMIQSRLQFESSAADIFLLDGKGKIRIWRNRSSGLRDRLPLEINLARHDGPRRLVYRLKKSAFNESGIKPFFSRCHDRRSQMAGDFV